jgi:hypothetical protein
MIIMDKSRPSTSPSASQPSLVAPNGITPTKSTSSRATSVASSDGHNDSLASSTDGALDRFKSRTSVDGDSSESGGHRRRISRLFKGRKGRRKSLAPEDLTPSTLGQDVPPVPDMPDTKALSMMNPPSRSEESLGLHKSVPSSLLTEDSDSEV